MQLKELKRALVQANLLMPEEFCTGVYKERDRQRLSHLISLARWAKNRCEDICLDAELDTDLLYQVLAEKLNINSARFKNLQDVMEALDDTPDLKCVPLDAAPNVLDDYCEAFNSRLSAVLTAEPWFDDAAADLFPEEVLIAPEPPIPGEDS